MYQTIANLILGLIVRLATKGEKDKMESQYCTVTLFALEIALDVETLVGSHENC